MHLEVVFLIRKEPPKSIDGNKGDTNKMKQYD